MKYRDWLLATGLACSSIFTLGIGWARSESSQSASRIPNEIAAQLKGGGCTWKFTSQNPVTNCTFVDARYCDSFEIYSSTSEGGSQSNGTKYCGASEPGTNRCGSGYTVPKDCAE